MLLNGRSILVTGVADTHSIAFAVAAAALREGARVRLTAMPRDLERSMETAAVLDGDVTVDPLDLTEDREVDAAVDAIRAEWGHLDGALHAVAFAPRPALAGDFLGVGPTDTARAFVTSTHTYAVVARMLRDLAPERGASLVGLDFDASAAWPVYNWMGVCKAGLESASRYVARDLGPLGIRSNLVAAGPLHTRAAGGIPEFDRLVEAWDCTAPLRWDVRDPGPTADAVVFLLSDLARSITGEVLHVDGGYHAMASALR
jgi:enoyl-[acyl-carrier protein] reductase I